MNTQSNDHPISDTTRRIIDQLITHGLKRGHDYPVEFAFAFQPALLGKVWLDLATPKNLARHIVRFEQTAASRMCRSFFLDFGYARAIKMTSREIRAFRSTIAALATPRPEF